jgi:hypothetical protein
VNSFTGNGSTVTSQSRIHLNLEFAEEPVNAAILYPGAIDVWKLVTQAEFVQVRRDCEAPIG